MCVKSPLNIFSAMEDFSELQFQYSKHSFIGLNEAGFLVVFTSRAGLVVHKLLFSFFLLG